MPCLFYINISLVYVPVNIEGLILKMSEYIKENKYINEIKIRKINK